MDSLTDAGAYAEAEAAAREALRLTEAAVGLDDPRVADRLAALGLLLEEGGDLVGAEPLYARALAIAEVAPGQPGLGDHLTDLGLTLQALGDHDRANPLFARAIDAYEMAGDTIAVGRSHYNRALGLFYVNELARARPHYETALSTLEAALGTDHADLAFPLTGLARVDHALGDYAAARAGYERAVALREAALGPDHRAVANDRSELGWLLIDIGDYAEAVRVSEQAVAATDSVRGAEAVLTRALYNLGVARARLGRVAEAEAAFERALAVREAALGPDHPAVAQVLGEQAALAERAGDLERARALHRRAAEIQGAALGAGHPNVAASLGRLAWAEARLGAGDSALAHARRSLAIWEAALPAGHPSTALSRTGLAEVLLLAGDDGEVGDLLLASNEALTDHARTTLPDLAWAEQRAFLDATLRRQTGVVLTALGGTPAFPAAYADVARWKGLLLHGLRRQAALARLADDPAHAETVAALAAARADLAAWFQRAGTMPLAAWQARNDSLNARKEGLERALARALPPGTLGDPLADVLDRGGADAFRARLPARTAFVDVYRYGHRAAPDSLVASYGAVVTSGEGVRFVGLGPAGPIDTAVDAWRQSVVRGGDGAEAWGALAGAVWGPLATALPADLDGVWVSPDGVLGRVPWSLLPGDGGPSVSVVDSARELIYVLDGAGDREGGAGAEPVVLAVGDVAFGEGYRFDPLPATAREVEVVGAVAGREGARVLTLTGTEATAEAVRERLPAATHVHLATHGVFEADAMPGEAGAWARSPLVESGLAFAGANEREGGVLTAETLVGVDQSGTELVVLSACETGLGTAVDGQGVMGLRAAFTTAGARAVVMSLWPVPDASTGALMRHFYEGLWGRGLSVADALAAAQATVRADPDTAAPVHWAGWMVVGRAW